MAFRLACLTPLVARHRAGLDQENYGDKGKRRYLPAWRAVAVASGLILAVQAPWIVAYGQKQLPSAEVLDAQDHTAWPLMADGRVVLTIYDVKIAIPTCARCLEYKFQSSGPSSSVSHRYEPTVWDVIAHPERLRYIAANSERVTLRLWNDWRPEVNKGPFLGRFDPTSLPPTSDIHLTIYKHSRTDPCWAEPTPHYSCLPVHELDISERRDAEIVGGMSVFRRPSSFPSALDYPMYLAPKDHVRDAIGLPTHFYCSRLGSCENSAFHTGGGFALRRNAGLFFTFQEGNHAYDFAPNTWIGLHDRTADAVRSLFLD